MTPSKSPERNTFQKNAYLKRCFELGEEPDASIIEMYESWAKEDKYENRPDNDLEYDLRTTPWILEKVRTNDYYAQNLYAAMCNMRWQKLDVLPILKDEYWTCSWRHSGGIIADMQQKGDYINWYCSGIRNDGYQDDLDTVTPNQYVSEGLVTDEIREDLNKLGWVPSEWPDEN